MPKCPTCDGTGEIGRRRCPQREAGGEDLREWCDTYLAWVAHGHYPAEGGRSGQAAWWLAATALADSERGRIERDRRALESAMR